MLYAEGCHLYKDRVSGLAQAGDRYAEAEAAAANSDVVILCVGLDATIEGEEGDTGNEFSSGDKNDLRLPESQRELIKRVAKIGKPMIVVCAAGSSINIEHDCDALIHAWYPGSEGGKAIADIILVKCRHQENCLLHSIIAPTSCLALLIMLCLIEHIGTREITFFIHSAMVLLMEMLLLHRLVMTMAKSM